MYSTLWNTSYDLSHIILTTLSETGLVIIPNLEISKMRLREVKPLTKLTEPCQTLFSVWLYIEIIGSLKIAGVPSNYQEFWLHCGV
jgi:hypothetical protein